MRKIALTIIVIFRTAALFSDVVGDISIHTVIGFNGLVKLGTWNPVIIDIENGGNSGSFDLVVEVRKGTSYRANRILTYSTRIDLPSGSRKRADFAVPIESSGLPITVRLESDGEVIFVEEHSMLGKTVRIPMVVALSKSSAFDFLVPESVVAYPHPELMPARWNAYAAADIVVLHDADLSNLSFDQTDAISSWVDAGGTLVIVGGPHFHRTEPAVEALVPFEIAGLSRIDGFFQIEGLTPIVSDNPIPISVFRTTRAHIVASAGGYPAIVKYRRGAGTIVAFSFDLGESPFTTWRDRREFWDRITDERGIVIAETETGRLFENPMIDALISDIDENPPSRLVYLLFAAMYVVAVSLLFRTITVRRRSIGRWMLLTAMLATSTIGAHWLFNHRLYNPSYLYISTTVAEYRSDAAHSHLVTDMAFISAKLGEHVVSLSDDAASILPKTRPSLRVERRGGTLSFRSEHDRPWTHDAFRIETMSSMVFGTEVEWDDREFTVSVTNHTEKLFLGSAYMYRGALYRSEPFAPGSVLERSFRYSTAPVADSIAEYLEAAGPLDPVKSSGLRMLLTDDRWKTLQEQGAVFLIAWSVEPLLEVSLRDRFQITRNESMLVVVISPGGNENA